VAAKVSVNHWQKPAAMATSWESLGEASQQYATADAITDR
jgi:hypothetical protein